MTPAMTTALLLHQQQGDLPRFPSKEDRAAWRRLNRIRASLKDDDWTKKVAAFRGLYDLEKHNRPLPGLLLEPRNQLHLRLLDEELDELKAGVADGNLPEVIDGILDLIYIALGFALELGFSPAQINLLMEEVHASNLTKVDEDGKPLYDDGGKVLKGPSYRKADIESLITKFQQGAL